MLDTTLPDSLVVVKEEETKNVYDEDADVDIDDTIDEDAEYEEEEVVAQTADDDE